MQILEHPEVMQRISAFSLGKPIIVICMQQPLAMVLASSVDIAPYLTLIFLLSLPIIST